MKHVVVSMDDLHKYADMPGYIMDKFHAGNIDGPHFADLVRIELLHGHGGVWMDATNFMTGPVPEWIMKQDYFMFHVPMDIPYGYYKFQNCFIRAKKNAFLLEAWRELAHEYWKDKWRNVDYFWIQLMMKTLVEGNEAANIYYNRMPHVLQDATHRLTPETFLDGPFDPALWSEIEKNSFFQKLARRRPALPGSWKEALIQMD
jgi:hypothetical protein